MHGNDRQEQLYEERGGRILSAVDIVKRRVGDVPSRRRRLVTVIGSGQTADSNCDDVGKLVASLGCDLLTGGGRGVMEAVSRAFAETTPRAGLAIGILPGHIRPMESVEWRERTPVEYELPRGYPNDWVELAIYTHLPDSGDEGTLRSSRNHINVLSADAIVALPGREGTNAEMWLATKYGVPVIAFGDHQGPLPDGVPHAETLAEVEAFLRKHLGLQ